MGKLIGSSDIKTFFVATVALSVAGWDVTFNLGVFGVIFFDKLFTAWVASTAALLASLFVPPPDDRDSVVAWKGRFVLALPTVWLLLGLIDDSGFGEPAARAAIEAITWVVAFVSLPYALYVVVLFVTPDLAALRNPRLLVAMAAIVATIGLTGFAVGRHNDRFLTCDDFRISGNDLPDRCAG